MSSAKKPEAPPPAAATEDRATQNGRESKSPPHAADDNGENGEAQDEVSAVERIKGRCDVCQKTDGFQGHRLLKCTLCGVCVHNLCIGKVTKKGQRDNDWKCVPCSAIGKRFVVKKSRRKTKTLLQEGRPQECAFCSCHTGTHHMHPLYNTHGLKGTHVVLPPSEKRNLPKRLVWVHTLCAMFISTSTGGLVYACDRFGEYGGESDESDDEDEDDSSTGSVSSSDPEGEIEDEAQKAKMLHPDDVNAAKGSSSSTTGEGGDAANRQSDENDGISDDDSGSDEDVELIETHHFVVAGKKNGNDTVWTRQLKEFRGLSCCFCGRDDERSTRIPLQCRAGSENEYEEFKSRHEDGVYCTQAMHVGCARWGPDAQRFKRVYFYPGQEEGASGLHSDPVAEIYCDLHAKDIFKNNPKRVAERKHHVPVSRRDRMMKRDANRREDSRNGGMMNRRNNASVPPPKRRRESEEYDGLDESELKRLVRGRVRRDWFPDIRDDVLEHVRSAMKRGQDVMEATTKCKNYWAKETEMPKQEFKKLWSEVKIAVQGEMSSNEQSSSSEKKPKSKKPATVQESIETTGQNPWSRLWMDDFCEGGEYNFDKWDECEDEDI